MTKIKTISFLFLFYCLKTVSCHRIQTQRDQSSDKVINDNPPTCDVVCEAQWKSEFHINYRKLFDTEYFEVPLDSIITKNRASLKMFCASTHQKYACLRRECKIYRTPWSPEKHICFSQYNNFERNINCLSLTDKYVQKECSSVCNSFRMVMSPLEIRRMAELHFSSYEESDMIIQNRHCTFIACHQMCHEYIINKICIDSSASARSLVNKYYEAFLSREYYALKRNGHDELFSSFCRRVTRGQDENAFTPNMTRFNNQILNRMKTEIRSVFSILD